MKHLLLALAGSITIGTHAQSSPRPYDMSPDWTATDINGDSHNLYALLDSGYTVIMDFVTTWCPPCIQYHQSHTLRNLYLAHGPGTAQNKVRVFMVECDPATDMDDLLGVGGQGTLNWVAGTPYPILDDAALAAQFNVTSYPTVLTICPSRMVSSISWPYGMAAMWAQAQVCGHHFADSPHDATLLGTFQDIPCRMIDEPLHTRLYNVGTAPLTEVMVQALDAATDEVVSTTTWTGNLPMYTQADVYLPAWSPAPGEHAVRYRIVTPDDDPDNDVLPDAPFHQASPSSPTLDITVEIMTDDGGGQLGWRLGPVVGNGLVNVLPGALQNNTLYTYNLTLPASVCHKLDLYDTGGEGLQAPGYFAVKSNGQPFLTAEECALTSSGTIHFLRAYFQADPSMSVPHEDGPSLLVSPNPAADRLRIPGMVAGAKIEVFDATGRSILRARANEGTTELAVAHLAEGTYVLRVSGAGLLASTRFQVLH